MTTFVLVHGSWHGAWCWRHVVPELEALGVRVRARDLPGHGDDQTPVARVTLRACAESVAQTVREAEEPVVLVGHSFAGIVITQVAEMVPEQISRLVYLSAFLPGDRDSLSRLAAAEKDNPVTLSSVLTPEGDAIMLDLARVRELFYPDCPESDAEFAIHRLRPEPLAPLLTPVAISAERAGRVPRAYIECLKDRALPIWLQRQMQAARPCHPVVSMATGHSPFAAAPAALALELDRLGRD